MSKLYLILFLEFHKDLSQELDNLRRDGTVNYKDPDPQYFLRLRQNRMMKLKDFLFKSKKTGALPTLQWKENKQESDNIRLPLI